MKNKSLKSKLFLDKENVFTLNDELLGGIKGGTDTLLPIDTLITPSDTTEIAPSDTLNVPGDTVITD